MVYVSFAKFKKFYQERQNLNERKFALVLYAFKYITILYISAVLFLISKCACKFYIQRKNALNFLNTYIRIFVQLLDKQNFFLKFQ